MELPNNGKVLIFDDTRNDITNLMQVLSKKKVPYLYYQDEAGNDLPESVIQGVRIVFLDLQLITGTTINPENIISTISGRLEKTIMPNETYVLIYWSRKENEYKTLLENAFNDRLKAYKPIISFSLNKGEALNSSKSDDEIFTYITEKLNEKTKDFKALKVFLFWENIINNSSSEVITLLTNLQEKNDKWNSYLETLIYKLGKAYSGKHFEDAGYELNNKIKDALFTLNQSFLDNIERNVSINIKDFEVINFESKPDFENNEFSSLINSKLLLSEGSEDGSTPGNIFFIIDEIKDKIKDEDLKLNKLQENILSKSPKKIENNEEREQSHIKKIKEYKQKINEIKNNYKAILNDCLKKDYRTKEMREKIVSESECVELNISPLCDYAQNKLPRCRLLPGILFPQEYCKYMNDQADFNYFCKATLKYNDKKFNLLFDFKYLKSENTKELKKRRTKLKLKKQLLADIQLKLGNHINRAGVLFVDND